MSWIIIDGYNLLPVIGTKNRDTLVSLLADYLHIQTKNTITVVFDATFAGDSKPYRTASSGVEIIYSPITQNADSLIDEMLSETRVADVIVVSSDRAVQRSATQYGKKFMSSLDFSTRLRRRQKPMTSSSDHHILEKKEYKRPVKKGGNPKRLSKKEKEQRKIKNKI